MALEFELACHQFYLATFASLATRFFATFARTCRFTVGSSCLAFGCVISARACARSLCTSVTGGPPLTAPATTLMSRSHCVAAATFGNRRRHEVLLKAVGRAVRYTYFELCTLLGGVYTAPEPSEVSLQSIEVVKVSELIKLRAVGVLALHGPVSLDVDCGRHKPADPLGVLPLGALILQLPLSPVGVAFQIGDLVVLL